jgi:hypothetical protein
MKYLDILFILAAAAIFFLLNEAGYDGLLSRYCVIVFIIAFYSGKLVTRWQSKKPASS